MKTDRKGCSVMCICGTSVFEGHMQAHLHKGKHKERLARIRNGQQPLLTKPRKKGRRGYRGSVSRSYRW